MNEPKKIVLTGYEVALHRGSKIFGGRAPIENGGGYGFLFTDKDGRRTQLALSEEAFHALIDLRALLAKEPYRTSEVLLAYEHGSDWHQINPPEVPPPEEGGPPNSSDDA